MRVKVLGRLEVIDPDGVRLPAEALPRRARQVLGALAARYDRLQSKDALADAVWGEDLPGNHVAALEHYVSVIRRRLHPGQPAAVSFIVTRSGGYLFDTGRASLDLADIRRLVRCLDGHPPGTPERLRLHQQVLELATDLPFAEDQYADWAAAARTEVRDAVLGALLGLADAARDSDPARALRLAQEAVELDAYVEQSYRLAMSASLALGRPDDALRWYDRCREVLDAELGVAPSAETSQLRRAVLELRPPAAAVPRAGAGEPLGRSPVSAPVRLRVVPDGPAPVAQPGASLFLGRHTEVGLILAAEPVPVVHIVGPAGAGKSELLAELRRRAPDRVGVGHGPSSAGPLRLTWLRSALADLGGDAAVLDCVDDAMVARQPLGHDELDRIAGWLARRAPVVLAVDDAAGLDEASVTELAWLTRRCPRLCVTLTYRYPSQVAERPVSALGSDVVLRLEPLTAEELAGLADPTLVERSGGIPALVAAAGRAPEVAAAVAMQIARTRTRWMPAAAWRILQLCATLGSLRVDDLAVLTELTVPQVLACVDQLVHAHLLTEGPGGHVRHRSLLVRDAVAAQVSAAHGSHLRERLAAGG